MYVQLFSIRFELYTGETLSSKKNFQKQWI